MDGLISRRESPVATLGANSKHCYACANVLDVRAELCPRCGVRQPSAAVAFAPQRPTTSRNRMVAVLLAFFLGGFGIHKFYLGRTSLGIVYLLFFWTLIPGLIAFIEMILLLIQSDDDFARSYPG